MMDFNREKYTKEIEEYGIRNAKYNISRGQGAEDLVVLLSYVDQLPYGATYVETGFCDGSAIMAVALHRPDLQCYGIDIQESGNYPKAKADLGFPNITFIHGDSTDIAKTWDKPIDLLFIDTGRHMFPQIFYDFAGWYPFVRPQAPILWHDYGEGLAEGDFEVGKAFNIFRDNPIYKTFIPVRDIGLQSSIAIITKPCEI